MPSQTDSGNAQDRNLAQQVFPKPTTKNGLQPGAYPPPYEPPTPPRYPSLSDNQTRKQDGLKRNAPLNQRASRSLSYGILSVFWSFVSMILTLMGVGHFISIGGLAVGIFAFYSGAIGLTRSYNLPGNTGRGQAIAGIILGAIGILLVIYIIATQGLYY